MGGEDKSGAAPFSTGYWAQQWAYAQAHYASQNVTMAAMQILENV
jgi:hypothetical protein